MLVRARDACQAWTAERCFSSSRRFELQRRELHLKRYGLCSAEYFRGTLSQLQADAVPVRLSRICARILRTVRRTSTNECELRRRVVCYPLWPLAKSAFE